MVLSPLSEGPIGNSDIARSEIPFQERKTLLLEQIGLTGRISTSIRHIQGTFLIRSM